MSRAEMLLAGHSHAMAMGLPVVARDARTEVVPIVAGRVGLVGAWPRTSDYWDVLEHEARGRIVVLSWQGTEYLARFLVAPEPLFDFVARARPDAPLVSGARLVPESAVRALFAKGFAEAGAIVARLTKVARVFVPAPPPPKDDDDLIRRRLLAEQGFGKRIEQLGVSPETVVFSPPLLRRKLWELTQDLLHEAVEAAGAVYVPCPPEARDAHGLLRREYWNEDITHANKSFGKLMLERIEALS